MLPVLAKEAEDTGYALHDAQFTRSVLLAQAGMFLLVAIEQHVFIAMILGFLGIAAFIYWHFHEIPIRQESYDAAHRKLMAAVWANCHTITPAE